MSEILKDNINMQPIVLIITGPCGSGKTTITNLIVQNNNFIRISGDDIKNELFPEIEYITDYPDLLEKVHNEVLHRTKKHFKKGESVVIDYILGQNRIAKYKKAFKESLKIRVLLSKKKVNIKRDKLRKCWTCGEEGVIALHDSFSELKSYIGSKNYIDNSEETPQETYLNHFTSLVVELD